jgi:hypothetical protein
VYLIPGDAKEAASFGDGSFDARQRHGAYSQFDARLAASLRVGSLGAKRSVLGKACSWRQVEAREDDFARGLKW